MPAEGEDDRRSDVSEARRRNTYTSREDDDPLTELLDDDDGELIDLVQIESEATSRSNPVAHHPDCFPQTRPWTKSSKMR